jgi:5-formyltetrahydrofolate cyclo-ligase
VDLAGRKETLRRSLAPRRRAVPAADAERASESVAARLAATPEWAAAARVALYAPASGELPTEPLVRAAHARGLPLLWPRLVGGGPLVFAACAPAELVRGSLGVLEPPRSRVALRLGAGDLVVLPGLAFDAAGRRLGRGGGHYDLALAGSPGPTRVGVGYAFQLVDEVPAGEGDERVDLVVTDSRLIRVEPARLHP